MASKTTKPTKAAEPKAEAPKELMVSISQSLWVRLKRAGLDRKFYETDAISRALLGDPLKDIFDELDAFEAKSRKEPAKKPVVKKG